MSSRDTPYSLLKVRLADGVATIAINRPEVFNNINFVVLHQLQLAFDEAISDPAVQGIVLTGEGKVFVVGADIEFLIRNVEQADIPRIIKFSEAGHRLMATIENAPKPVVARVHGAALGGGSEIALACHTIVAGPAASFGFPETGLGIFPGFGGTQRAPRKIGMGLAKWMIFTGKTISAADAAAIGLADCVVSGDELDATCRALARGERHLPSAPSKNDAWLALEQFFVDSPAEDLRLQRAPTGGNQALARAMKLVASKGPIGLRFAERVMDEGRDLPFNEALRLEIKYVPDVYTTHDALVGLKFRVSRSLGLPVFEGR